MIKRDISQNIPSQQTKPDTANVLIISLHADPVQPSGNGEGGGTHAYLRELLRGLARECRNATVVTRHAHPNLPAEQRLSDFTAIRRIQLGDIAPIDKRFLDGFHARTVELVSEIIHHQKWKPHVLHGVYWNSGRAAMDVAKRLGIPFVQTVISNGKRRALEGFSDNANNRITIETEVFHAASVVFCISSEERHDLIELYGVDPKKLHVVGRPVPLPFRRPAQAKFGEARNVDLHSEDDGHDH